MTNPYQSIRKRGHPGAGKNRAGKTSTGRQASPAGLPDDRDLLADRSRRRDHLIKNLHLIRDSFGFLSATRLSALAQEMRLALAEVYEVATFYLLLPRRCAGQRTCQSGARSVLQATRIQVLRCVRGDTGSGLR